MLGSGIVKIAVQKFVRQENMISEPTPVRSSYSTVATNFDFWEKVPGIDSHYPS